MGVNPVCSLNIEKYIYHRLISELMTHQEFNHIYYLFTRNKNGIKPSDRITTTGRELKEFIEFTITKLNPKTP